MSDPPSASSQAKSPAPRAFGPIWRIPVYYAVFAAAWIAFSDMALKWALGTDPSWVHWGMVKGFAFVAITTVFLWMWVRKSEARLRAEWVERRKALHSRQNSEDRFQVLFDGLVDPAFLTDGDRKIRMANPAARRVFLAAEGPTESFFLSRAEYRDFGARVARIVESGGGSLEWRLKTVDGPRDFAIAVSPLPDGTRYCLLTDITERKATEAAVRIDRDALKQRVAERTATLERTNRELQAQIAERERAEAATREAKEAAEAANRSKTVFLANMSHEIRTPMNAILGYCQLLRSDPHLPDHVREPLETMFRSGEHLMTLLNEVLDMSKIEAGHTCLQTEPVDLLELRNQITEMFRQRADARGIAFRLEGHGLDHRWVRADLGKLRQVLVNLLGNAIKFTQEGWVSLDMKTRSRDDGRIELSVWISDTGQGVDPGEVEAIFEAFAQGTAEALGYEGTGLGLAICREFVRLMDGDIVLGERLGGGSVFRFWVVLDSADAADATPAPCPVPWPGVRIRSAAEGAPPRVLVAEDRQNNRDILVRMLEQLGAEVYIASDGAEAVAEWERRKPAVILMDMRMPVVDGLEATRRILHSAEAGDRPIIIAVTASVFEEERSAVFAAGCQGIIRKPFRLQEIMSVLQETVGWEFEAPPEATPFCSSTNGSGGVLPQALRKDLLDAAIRGDIFRIQTIIRRMESIDSALAAHAAALMTEFDYEGLIQLLEAVESEGANGETEREHPDH